MTENSYGILKRFEYIERAILDREPRKILDYGCGTGEVLTAPLAERFPEIEIVGVDDDPVSIEFARSRNADRRNLSFHLPDELDPHRQFDLVIASEVIEHVEDPGQFLRFLRHRLGPGGAMVITLPNGYGPFEMTALVESLLFIAGLDLGGIYKRLFEGNEVAANEGKYSLAISPHINFFSYRSICSLMNASGLKIRNYRGRSLFCGIGFDQLIRGNALTALNNAAADHLPPMLISDWMFILEPGTGENAENAAGYPRGRYGRLRRSLNEKRWGIARTG